MLYELISVIRPGAIKEVKEVARTAGSLVIQNGGVVRGLTNWGVFHMPKPTKGPKGSAKHHIGHYFIMRFDASPQTQHSVRRTLGLEPRLLRFSCVRLGRSLGDIAEFGGKPDEWKDNPEANGIDSDMESMDYQLEVQNQGISSIDLIKSFTGRSEVK